ncbi:MAG: bifunctional folylpolyglutamate synthase/dihydrofolate synthase [Ruminococcaceae bacterium]|nr:bifunctional folylpolyglutamate synthase/dihydrofolate synthase [Oscillospiraceae bacterium]
MDYTQSLDYIHSISWTFCKPGLERIGRLCELLGHPERSLKFVHVAGTNGKGSFCSMMSSILTKSGYKTGLYTSPYIRFFNERMCIDGEPISNDELAEITTYVRPLADSMEDTPTEFELITAVALEYFKRNGCDVVVLEAGMGGRLDSTNIIREPLLSVITGIALDHTAFLGDTVEQIAAEKAGIIKDHRPVLFGGDDKGAADVIERRAKENGSEYFSVDYSALCVKAATLDGTEFSFGKWENMRLGLLALYQPKNACVVLSAVDILRKYGFEIDENAVREGIAVARWQARFEIIDRTPLTIFDGAHNPQGIDSAVDSVKHYFENDRVYILTGVLRDKDYTYIASRLSEIASKAFVMSPDSPRALPSEEYADVLSSFGVQATPYTSLKEAYEGAAEAAKRDGVPLICLGSLYTYSELMEVMGK